MATRMQQRRSPASDWSTANPILAAGELGYEIDTNKFKIGDGINHWADLSYFDNIDNIGGSLGEYVPLAQKGADNGVATLDSTGNVPFSQLGNIIDGAPGVLDTLNEIANAIGDDASFITTITTSIGTKQDKVSGVSDTEIGYLDGVTSSIQTQLNSKLDSAILTEAAQDAVNSALTAGTGITKTYDDAGNTITVAVDSTIATKTYADGKASDAVITAESYTDTAISSEVTSRNSAIATAKSEAISAAASDATTKANSAITTAESFATSADSTLHTTITGEIATAKSQAISTSEGYTDTAISSEVTNRNSAISTAKSEAITTSEGYTDTAISTEVTNRNSAIATAKSQAISTAESYTDTAITNLVNAAPSTLDTLKEIADAIAADESTAAALATTVGTKLSSATAASTYETITNVALKAPLASPALTGTPTAPTATAGTNTTQVSTTAFVKTAIDALKTADIEEDTNLYFTDQRAVDAVTYAINHGLNVTLDGGTP